MKDPKMLAGLAVMVLAAGWVYVKPNYIDAKPTPAYTDEELEHAPRPVLLLGERILNLAATREGRERYVKLELVIEFNDPAHALVGKTAEQMAVENEELRQELARYMPDILDTLHQTLGSPEYGTITAASAGPFKEQFLAEVNRIVEGRAATAVYLPTFITQ